MAEGIPIESEIAEKKLFERKLTPKSLRIFLSFKQAEDGELAHKIKENLEFYGLEVFVAHDDINPSTEWQEEIMSELKSCDIFMPILTDNFRKSMWTDQEVGMAVISGKKIIPIKVTQDPHGFIGKYQALRLNPDDVTADCLEIIDTICKYQFLKDKVKDCLIASLEKAPTYYRGDKVLRLLEKYETPLTKEQINEIIRISILNDQIYEGYHAKNVLPDMFERYRDVIDPLFQEKFKERYLSSEAEI